MRIGFRNEKMLRETRGDAAFDRVMKESKSFGEWLDRLYEFSDFKSREEFMAYFNVVNIIPHDLRTPTICCHTADDPVVDPFLYFLKG